MLFTSVGNKDSLSERVAFEIESAINSKKIQKGNKLPTELELCKQFNVSRTSIREALRTLSAKGMISIEKGRGIYVKKISSDTVTDPMQHYLKLKIGVPYVLEVIEARKTIEPEIARFAALNRTNEDIDKMKLDIEKMKNYNGGPEGLAHIDIDFHENIAHATQNRLLPLIIKPIFRLMPMIKSKIISGVPNVIESAIVWHTKILDAIIARDSIKAYDAMKQHLLIAKEHVNKMLIVEQVIIVDDK